MANVLGSLLVLLRADTAEFVAGMGAAGREAKRAGAEIEESFSRLGGIVSSALAPFGELGAKISETFAKVGEAASQARISAGAMGAVFGGVAAGAIGLGGALVAAALHAAEVGNQIYEAGEKTGLATETLKGLMAIAKLTGGNFEELASSIAKAEANLAKGTLTGSKANQVLLDIEGGAKGAAELGLKPMDERLQIVLKRIFDLNDTGQRNLALTALMKNAWQGNLETLEKWADSADRGAQAAKDLGLAMDPKESHDLVNAMNDLKGQLDAVSLTIGSKLEPYIIANIASILAWKTVWYDLGESLVDVGKIIADVAQRDFGAATAAVMDIKARNDDADATVARITADIKAMGKAMEQSGTNTGTVTGATKEHTTALERAAEASREFWAEYNAGLKTATERLPPVVSMQQELMKALHPGEIQMPTGEWREIPNIAETMKQIQELQKFDIAKEAPGGVDPFGQMATSAQNAIAPISNLNFQMRQIMKIDPSAVSPLRAKFDTFFKEVAADGAHLTDKLTEDFRNFTADVSQQLASLVVTGRTNFRSLFLGLEQEVIKSGIQAIFAKLATSLLPSTKPSPGPNTATGAASGAAGFIGKIFGGFLQYGGDVTPGRAYVVGERHAEFFVPNQAGQIRPTLAAGAPHTTVVNFHVNGVQDYDSFRRSSSQIMALMQNQMATAYSRNR